MNKKDSEPLDWVLVTLIPSLFIGMILGVVVSESESPDIVINNYNQSERDVYGCEEECKEWFYVFNNKDSLSCGGMWVTDCFKYCYEKT